MAPLHTHLSALAPGDFEVCWCARCSQESIEILLNVMENNKEDLIVVLAGYKDRMDRFYSFIPVRSSAISRRPIRGSD